MILSEVTQTVLGDHLERLEAMFKHSIRANLGAKEWRVPNADNNYYSVTEDNCHVLARLVSDALTEPSEEWNCRYDAEARAWFLVRVEREPSVNQKLVTYWDNSVKETAEDILWKILDKISENIEAEAWTIELPLFRQQFPESSSDFVREVEGHVLDMLDEPDSRQKFYVSLHVHTSSDDRQCGQGARTDYIRVRREQRGPSGERD